MIVLLGAGASCDAGLPLTSDLASAVVKDANSDETYQYGWQAHNRAWIDALNFVYGQMVGHQTDDGGNPLDAVNIEKLISAVRLLQSRESHEVAPFVASWKPGALSFGSPTIQAGLSAKLKNSMSSALSNNHSSPALADVVAEVALAAVRPESSFVFKAVERQLLIRIKSHLRTPTKSLDYLRPLAAAAASQVEGLDVITLNYDQTVETMVDSFPGVSLDTGVDRLSPGRPLVFSKADANINLYKLHGSIDWTRQAVHGSDETTTPPIIERGDVNDDSAPWIVVGDRDKLGTDGPTLALLRAAEGALERAGHLVVVGYSFGDQHINALIRDWMHGGVARTMTVLDIEWPNMNARGDVRAAYLRAYGGHSGGFLVGDGSAPARFLPIKGSASKRLAEALSVRPAPDPDPYIEAMLSGTRENLTLILKNLGPDLNLLTVGANNSNANVFDNRIDRERFRGESYGVVRHNVRRSVFARGKSLKVFPLIAGTFEDIVIHVSGGQLSGLRSFDFRFSLADNTLLPWASSDEKR